MIRLVTICVLLIVGLISSISTDFVCPPDATDDFLPDPDNCEVFYRCTNGQQFRFTCGPGTVFNPSIRNCDWPSAVGCSPEANKYKQQKQQHQKKPKYPDYPQQPNNNYQETNYPSGDNFPERNVNPSPGNSGNAHNGGWPVSSSGGSSLPSTSGDHDVEPVNSGQQQQGNWNNNQRPSSSGGTRHQVRPDRQQNRPQPVRKPQDNSYENTNRQPYEKRPENTWGVPDSYESTNSNGKNPQGYGNGNTNTDSSDGQDELDQRTFDRQGSSTNENNENGQRKVLTDGKHPWKVPNPSSKKDSPIEWNEMPSKSSTIPTEEVNRVYDDPYPPTSSSSSESETRQQPSSGRIERPTYPTDNRSYRPSTPPSNSQRGSQDNNYDRNRDQYNQQKPNQPKYQEQGTTNLPDSPIVYRPAQNRDNGNNQRNNPRQDNRRYNKPKDPEPTWDSEAAPSFSKNIEPSPDLARDPNPSNQRKQGYPGNEQNQGSNRWVNPKTNRPDKQSPDQPPENQPFESQRLNPSQRYGKTTDKETPVENDDENLNQTQQPGKINRPTKQPTNQWDRNQSPNRNNQDDWKRRTPSSPYQPTAQESPDEDPATQTQWYRPKLSPTSTTETPQYETPLNRPREGRYRDPNVSTSPYADKHPENRVNPSPRPVYRPDRRQGELRPTPSSNQRQGQNNQRQQQVPPNKSNENQWSPQPRPVSPTRQQQNRQQPDPWGQRKDEPYDEQIKEDEQSFESSNIEPRFPDESDVAQVMNDMYVQDPYSIPDLMTNLPCNETTLNDCEKCDKLKWLKLSQVTLKSQPDEAIKTLPALIVTDCFRRCHSQGCVAYSYNQRKGHCKLFYGQVNEDHIESDSDYVTVIKEPTSALLADQWLYTDHSEPIGKDMGQFKSPDSISCLRACINVGDHCKAVSYNSVSQLCKIYDSMNGERLILTGSGTITLQHISIHNKGDAWRFSSMGNRKFNTSIPIMSFAISEDQECYEECLNSQGCLAISIEGKSPKECQIYNKLETLSDESSSETQSASSSQIATYLMKIPLNSSHFLHLPGLYFSGKPLKKYEQFNLKDCQEVVKSIPTAIKITYLKESQVCYIFSDAAKLGLWKNPEIEAISFLVNLPADPKYLAYKRLTGLTLTHALLAPKGEKHLGTQSASACLDSCLKTENCSAVAVTYSDIQDSVECILLKEDELSGKPRFVFKEDTDLFVRTLPANLVPELGEKDDQCSLRINVPSANDNLPYFEKEKSKKQSESSLLEKAEQFVNKANPFHNNEKKSGQLREPKKLNDDDEVFDEMIPHGLEFEGMIEKLNEDDESVESFVDNGQRSKRSIYAMTLRGAQVYDETIEQNQNKNPLEAGAEAGFAVRDLLSGSLGMSDNNSTENILLSRFLKRAQDVSQNPRLSEDIVSSIKSSARKVRSNESGESKEDRIPCKVTKGSTVKEAKCRPDEICSNVPYIVHGDQKAMTNCSNTRVNSTCQVICKSGYRSSKGRLVCEVIGSTTTWNTKDISCVPDESMCSELPWIPFTTIKSTPDDKKLNYLIKYDETKKLPLFGVYKFTTANENNQVSQSTRSRRSADDSIVALPCSQLKLNQLSNMNYKQTNYTKGYLVPPSAFPVNPDARKLVNYFVNTAPQDSYTAQGPWSLLTDTIHGYLKSNNQSGFIINGVCSQQIYSPSTSSLPVPKCFWKTVCTRAQSGQVTSATFYHDNQPIDQDDQSNQKKRFEEVFSYTNPEFVKSLINVKDYDSLWPEILDRFSTSSSKTVQDEMMILQCAASIKIDPKMIDFWNTLLLNGTDNPSESLLQSDDLNSSESQSSPVWSQKLTDSSSSSPSSPSSHSSSSADCEKRLIGYIGLNGDTINSTTISSSPITHLTLMGAIKINENGSLSLGNDTKKVYDRLYELKSLKNDNPDIKILIALGGWSNSQWFTKISRSPNVQKTFIMDIIAFLDYWEFDGVDIVWQYPNIGGKVKGSKEDKDNLNRLMQNIKDSMIDHQSGNGRSEPYSLVLTGPGLYWILDYGYDLKTLINHVDWINIMAFDFHGPWNSSWGDYTGPMAPLYFGSPDGFPGKLNIDAIVKRYVCETGRPDKLVLGLGFFGRAWTNVGNHVDETKDDLFRKASPVKDGSKGSMVSYRKLTQEWLTKGEPVWHNKTRTSFLWNRMKRSLVSFESEDSLKEKVSYADAKGLGGLMVWSLDMDDSEGTLLKSIGGGLKCNSNKKSSDTFKCNPLAGEKRHWTQYDDNGTKDRLCGKRAPLINGHYPICDPDDPGYSCCSSSGYCGSGPDFCECEGCVDYGSNPERTLNDSTVPSSPSITWLTTDLIEDLGKPDCGLNSQKMVNGSSPVCNPEDPKKHCCSSTGFCGTGPDYCECKGCVNFNKNSSHVFPEKNWFDWSDGPENAGRCGPQAPRIKGRIAGCDPKSETAHCCGPNGYCGTGPDYCSCKECVNFTSKPIHDWS